MKPLFLSLIFIAAALGQQRPAQVVGTGGVSVTTVTNTFSITATGPQWAAFSWVPQENHTVAKVRIMINSVTGTLGAADMQLDIYADAGTGNPGSIVSGCTSTTVTATPTTAAFVEWSGFTCAITAFSQYWFVVKNPNTSGNGATFTMRYGASTSGAPLLLGSSSSQFGSFMVNTTLNGGSTWASLGSSVPFIRVEYLDSAVTSYAGNPLNNFGPVDATHQTFGTHEAATLFTTGVIGYKVRGVVLPCGKQGSPSGNLQIKMYQGSSGTLTLLGTTNNLPGGYFGTGGATSCTFYFPTVLTLNAATTFRIALSDTATDSTTIYYKGYPTFFDNDANSKALLPFGGTVQQQYCNATCLTASNWADVAGQFLPFALILDYAGEYVTPAAGAGPTAYFYVQ